MTSITLDNVPLEVLEHIAFYTATTTFLGPPSALLPLLLCNRQIKSCLSITANHVLYSRIFASKFDIAPIVRRLGIDQIHPASFSAELQRRCIHLKRLRSRLDSIVKLTSNNKYVDEPLRSVLWTAYLMMLENDGKNGRQLREYGRIDDWLREFWFDEFGASFAKRDFKMDQWPPNNEHTSLAMWLFWFLLKPEDYKDDEYSWNVINILKIFALAAHKYDLTSPSWVHFRPEPAQPNNTIRYFGSHPLNPTPLAAPAILSFMALVNKLLDSPSSIGYSAATISPPNSQNGKLPQSDEWECEWGRCLSLGVIGYGNFLIDSYRPGSIEGIWEGVFTYTEFTAYAALLSGAPPPVLQKSMVVRHRQTWKLREYHLLAADPSHSDSGIEMDSDNIDPLPAGDPLRSYFPTGTHISEHLNRLEVREWGSKESIQYRRASILETNVGIGVNVDDESSKPCIQDVIITGEGHSAWGQFNLVGRVRPCDGFISLCKEYVDGDRGRWLYRGYLVGHVNGNLTGRWRDTLSPAEVSGYEGCFTMSRRR